MPSPPIPWPSKKAVLAALAKERPGAQLFTVDTPHALTVACLEQDRCEIVYEGEATPQMKMAVLAQAKQAGFAAFDGGVLVDFSRFTGVIDWEYARQQENIVPGFPPPPKVAYVARDDMAAMFAKGILSFSKNIEWQVFTSRRKAVTWLGWV